jgi:hypothetical protein
MQDVMIKTCDLRVSVLYVGAYRLCVSHVLVQQAICFLFSKQWHSALILVSN